ncbi:hypothetical protein GCM10027516_30700 [Niabella aquatica]
MQQEYSTVIADTSCFILLDTINMLPVLQKIFGAIATTPEVAAEYGKPLPPWININIRKVQDPTFKKQLLQK